MALRAGGVACNKGGSDAGTHPRAHSRARQAPARPRACTSAGMAAAAPGMRAARGRARPEVLHVGYAAATPCAAAGGACALSLLLAALLVVTRALICAGCTPLPRSLASLLPCETKRLDRAFRSWTTACSVLIFALLAARPTCVASQQLATCAAPRSVVQNFTVGWTADVWNYTGSVAAHQWTYVPYTLGRWGGNDGTLVRVVVSQNISGTRSSSVDIVTCRSSTFTGGGSTPLYLWWNDYDPIPAGQPAFALSLIATLDSDAQLEPWRSYQYGTAANFYFESMTPSSPHSISVNTTFTFVICVSLANLSTAAGWCRAGGAGGGVTCNAAAPQAMPPSCLPPGGAWLGYNASAGGWTCVCEPGWSGPNCTSPGSPSAGVSCGAPPVCATGKYTYSPGTGFTCMTLACAPTADRVAQCAVLGALYSATNGTISQSVTSVLPGFGHSSVAWDNAAAGIVTDFCTFTGVGCSYGTTNFTSLFLDGATILGTIPAQIGALTSLSSLYISRTAMTGTIPSALGSLTALLSLSITNMPGLGGSIPPALGLLTALQSLSINGLPGLGGSIPSQLGALTALTYLAINNNALTGTVPASLGALTRLAYFYLGANQLCGTLPGALATAASAGAGGTNQLPPCNTSSPQSPPVSPQGGVTFTCDSSNDATLCGALRDLYTGTARNSSWYSATGWADAAAGIPTNYCSFYGVNCSGGVVNQLCAAPQRT